MACQGSDLLKSCLVWYPIPGGSLAPRDFCTKQTLSACPSLQVFHFWLADPPNHACILEAGGVLGTPGSLIKAIPFAPSTCEHSTNIVLYVNPVVPGTPQALPMLALPCGFAFAMPFVKYTHVSVSEWQRVHWEIPGGSLAHRDPYKQQYFLAMPLKPSYS